MPFFIIFGLILTIIGFVIKNSKLEVDENACPNLQEQQRQDIIQNKKSSKVLTILGPILAVIGLIGTLL